MVELGLQNVRRSIMSNSLRPPWTVAHQAPLSMGFSRQEYWSRLPCPPPEDLPNPGIKPRSPSLQEDSLPSEPPGKPRLKMLVAQTYPTLCDPMDGSLPGSTVHEILHSLLQGIFPTQGSNPGLLHCRRILYHLSHQGGPHCSTLKLKCRW